MHKIVAAFTMITFIAGCLPEEETGEPQQEVVRGLITTLVSATEETTVRRCPGVLEAGEVNVLSFEVGGRLGRVNLEVGQRVTAGEQLATLDSDQFLTAIESSRAAIEEVSATLEQAKADLERSENLLSTGAGTRVSRDEDAARVRGASLFSNFPKRSSASRVCPKAHPNPA